MHQLQLQRRLVTGDLLAFELTQPVLGADAAFALMHEIVHDSIDVRSIGDQRLIVLRVAARQVVVQIAVSEVAEGDYAHSRKSCLERFFSLAQKVGDAAYRQRYVMLDTYAFAL